VAARQDEPPRLWRGIDHALQIRCHLGRALDFVQDRTLHVLRQKATRVVCREAPRVGIFQRHVGLFGKQTLGQRGLAALAGPGEGDHWIFSGQLLQQRCDVAFDHDAMVKKSPAI